MGSSFDRFGACVPSHFEFPVTIDDHTFAVHQWIHCQESDLYRTRDDRQAVDVDIGGISATFSDPVLFWEEDASVVEISSPTASELEDFVAAAELLVRRVPFVSSVDLVRREGDVTASGAGVSARWVLTADGRYLLELVDVTMGWESGDRPSGPDSELYSSVLVGAGGIPYLLLKATGFIQVPEVCIGATCQPATVVASHEADEGGFVLLRLRNDGGLSQGSDQVVVDGRRYLVFLRE